MDNLTFRPNNQAIKADKGKWKITLVPTQILKDISEVREYGIEKYGSKDNWMYVEKERYINALGRHLEAYIKDQTSVDNDSKIEHIKHIACNVAFLCEMEEWARK